MVVKFGRKSHIAKEVELLAKTNTHFVDLESHGEENTEVGFLITRYIDGGDLKVAEPIPNLIVTSYIYQSLKLFKTVEDQGIVLCDFNASNCASQHGVLKVVVESTAELILRLSMEVVCTI